ncbi:beta-1,3-glucan-binding protein-like isoform X2 [Eupeodes corollae]|uniref:beta-1,3-glucan-binding protein-like isoform X2 n=1 Tax=Eupeodes corollae TaxID=290404 RepID=UPI0024933D21|nr:beta-1,3-glucan-binding protein-like isoform X2 [Eupeodes corollae]
MKFIFTIILFLSVLVEFSFEYTASVHRISPKGFRIKSSSNIVDDRITYVIYNVNINRTLTPDLPTDFVAVITESILDQWVYINLNARVEGGSKIYYRMDVFHDPYDPNAKNKPVSSMEKEAELPYYTIDISEPVEERCAALYRISERCQLSVTTVSGQRVCKEKLIFQEHFDNLDPKIWKIDARIPTDTEDSPFVSFQNDPEVVYIKNGWLNIKPKFLSKASGFNESSLMTGTLNIAGCSGREQECMRKAKFSQILPPIISGRIRTKHSFNFRYGKIVIGATMPKGDWVIPMLLLENLENFYGPSNYASGQIRIASLRGNQILRTAEGKVISSRYLSGGVVLEDRGPLHDSCLRHYDAEERVSDEFHNFTLTWTEDDITVGIDDYEYGKIEGGFSQLFVNKSSPPYDSDHKMAPFDREFYLSIGLSVGGHIDFPDYCRSGEDRVIKPWINNDPKAMFNFWKDRQNWMRSWEKYDTKLQVNFILVYAL